MQRRHPPAWPGSRWRRPAFKDVEVPRRGTPSACATLVMLGGAADGLADLAAKTRRSSSERQVAEIESSGRWYLTSKA